MPESLSSLLVVELEKLHLAVSFEWSEDIPEEPLIVFFNTFFGLWVEETLIQCSNSASVFYLSNNDLFSKLLGDSLGNVEWRSLE